MKLSDINNGIKKILHFGPYIPITNIILTYFSKYLPEHFLNNIAAKRNIKIQNIISHIIDFSSTNQNCCSYNEIKTNNTDIIWFFWMQGKKNLPSIPKICYESIIKNSNGHQVIFLDADNYSKYVKINPLIIDLFQKGKLKRAHFADILRVNLLAQQGGLWLDATIFVSTKIPDTIFSVPFFSIKTKPVGHFVSQCRWAVFCLGGKNGQYIFQKVAEMFNKYLSKCDMFVDYFMFDQFIDILYKTDENVKEMIDTLLINNENVHKMQPLLCNEYDENIYRSLTNQTYLFKLNWKEYSTEELENNKNNLYHHLKDINL